MFWIYCACSELVLWIHVFNLDGILNNDSLSSESLSSLKSHSTGKRPLLLARNEAGINTTEDQITLARPEVFPSDVSPSCYKGSWWKYIIRVSKKAPHIPSPASPSPAPYPEEKSGTSSISHRVFSPRARPATGTEREGGITNIGAAAFACVSACARTITAAPPPVAKVSFKDWQARRKPEHAKEEEVAQERERERQLEQEHERERQREREKDATQGEDKENEVVPVKAEDGLSRILDGIRRSAVSDKPSVAELPVPQDVKIANARRGVSHALAEAGDGIKREASPLTVNDVASPAILAPKSPPSDGPASPSSPQPALHSPQAPRYPSPLFTSNGVQRPTPSLSKPFHHLSYQSSFPTPAARHSASIGVEACGRSTAHADNPLCYARPVFSIFFGLYQIMRIQFSDSVDHFPFPALHGDKPLLTQHISAHT
ncbi:hypothetical protein C8R45DRAFT_1070201 [Mycena sanguinolenta]|nr:hypothetical protein C8R45DRAFT_1070201 [Mycena sanguinolenta]